MLLVVSLDSENEEWLREHMDNGSLPNLAALARSGVVRNALGATLPGCAYPTLYTGHRPADLGCYFPLQWEPNEQRVVSWTRLPAETLFTRLEKAGKRIVVLDPPETHPLRLTNGYIGSGIQFRARVLLHSWSSDPIRTKRLFQKLGPAPRADEFFGKVSASDLRYLRSALLEAPARLTAAALDFMRQDTPDCLWLTCCGLHVAGHQFFHLPSIQDADERRKLEGTRLDLARGYDRMIGTLLEAAPAGTRTLVAYAKGMGHVTQWSDLLPEMLRRILRQKEGNQPSSLLRRLLPRSLRRWVAYGMTDHQALEVMARMSTPRANWSETRAFCLPTDSAGFIRFNLAGRERDGIVPNSALHDLQAETAAGLQTFTTLDGQPCTQSILTPRDLLGNGTYLHCLPDLIVKWTQREGEPADALRSPVFGEIQRTAEIIGRSGNHRLGVFVILPRCYSADHATRPMELEDIPATLIDALGLPADGLPGKSYWPRRIAA